MNKLKAGKTELKILESCARATNKSACMNVKEAKEIGDESWSEFEATFVALLYHELIESGVDYWRISLENKPNTDNEKHKDKKIDLWVETDEDITYMIEVKLIIYKEKSEGLRRMNSMAGVRGDLDKLKEIIKNNPSVKGIVIGAYTGKAEVKLKEIIEKIDEDTKSYLSENLKLIVSTSKECKFL